MFSPKILSRKPLGIASTRTTNDITDVLNSLGQVTAGLVDDRQAGARVVRVRVYDPAVGGGKYKGYFRAFPNTVLNRTVNLIDSDFGDLQQECLILNAAERGQSTHDLTDGTPASRDFIGVIVQYLAATSSTEPAMPVVEINGYDFGDCE